MFPFIETKIGFVKEVALVVENRKTEKPKENYSYVLFFFQVARGSSGWIEDSGQRTEDRVEYKTFTNHQNDGMVHGGRWTGKNISIKQQKKI